MVDARRSRVLERPCTRDWVRGVASPGTLGFTCSPGDTQSPALGSCARCSGGSDHLDAMVGLAFIRMELNSEIAATPETADPSPLTPSLSSAPSVVPRSRQHYHFAVMTALFGESPEFMASQLAGRRPLSAAAAATVRGCDVSCTLQESARTTATFSLWCSWPMNDKGYRLQFSLGADWDDPRPPHVGACVQIGQADGGGSGIWVRRSTPDPCAGQRCWPGVSP